MVVYPHIDGACCARSFETSERQREESKEYKSKKKRQYDHEKTSRTESPCMDLCNEAKIGPMLSLFVVSKLLKHDEQPAKGSDAYEGLASGEANSFPSTVAPDLRGTVRDTTPSCLRLDTEEGTQLMEKISRFAAETMQGLFLAYRLHLPQLRVAHTLGSRGVCDLGPVRSHPTSTSPP